MNDSPVPKRSAPSAGPTVLVSNRQDDVAIDQRALADLAERTLAGEDAGSVELSLSFVGLDEMSALHQRYMGEPGPTDVLSFPMGEDGLLGDAVVCPAFAAGNTGDLESELRLLVVHGVLHLLGYDHEEEDERRMMWQKQESYSGVRLT
jgi:probable rRNA maturation factor